MTAKFKPGPWRYDYADGYCGEMIAADGTYVCIFTEEPSDADAAMLATAPELHEALKLLLKEVEHSGNADSKHYGWPKAIAASRAALAKATGSAS